MSFITDVYPWGRSYLEIVAMILMLAAFIIAFCTPEDIRWQPFGSRLAMVGIVLSAAISGKCANPSICYAFVVGFSLYYIIAIIIATLHHFRQTVDRSLFFISLCKIQGGCFFVQKNRHQKTTLSSDFLIIWHLANFPQSSIFAATGLNFCVRNENRCFPSAMGTKLQQNSSF